MVPLFVSLFVVAEASFKWPLTDSASCSAGIYQGTALCYDNKEVDILEKMLYVTPDSIGIDKCATECDKKGFSIVGVQGGSKPLCFCGNSITAPPSTATGCNVPCPVVGPSGLPCGGENTLMSIYAVVCSGRPGTGSGGILVVLFILFVVLAVAFTGMVAFNVLVANAGGAARFSPLTTFYHFSAPHPEGYSRR